MGNPTSAGRSRALFLSSRAPRPTCSPAQRVRRQPRMRARTRAGCRGQGPTGAAHRPLPVLSRPPRRGPTTSLPARTSWARVCPGTRGAGPASCGRRRGVAGARRCPGHLPPRPYKGGRGPERGPAPSPPPPRPAPGPRPAPRAPHPAAPRGLGALCWAALPGGFSSPVTGSGLGVPRARLYLRSVCEVSLPPPVFARPAPASASVSTSLAFSSSKSPTLVFLSASWSP